MNCPKCGAECWRDEVDIGVGIQSGPWRCDGCGWIQDVSMVLLDRLTNEGKMGCELGANKIRFTYTPGTGDGDSTMSRL